MEGVSSTQDDNFETGDGKFLTFKQMPSANWLDAHNDPLATIYTFSSCICLADLNGDGDNKLIIADLGTGAYNMKLKVYKGTSLLSEHTVIDLPTGVVAFHMDTCDSKAPAVAVASGSHIYIYKNMRPFYKFTLPALDIKQAELEVWNQIKNEKIDMSALKEVLENLRSEIGEANMTARSQRLLMLDGDEAEEFANIHRQFPLKKQTVITCLATMNKSMAEDDAVSCLVQGTENKDIYVLEPDAFTILAAMKVPAVPVFLDVKGIFDVEFKIMVACRDGSIYFLKRGYKAGKIFVELSSQPIGFHSVNNNFVVACMDKTLSCYSAKGKCLWQLKMHTSIVSTQVIDLVQQSIRLIAVSLDDGLVQIYQDKYVVDVVRAGEVVTAMKYGQFGREDNTLILVTKSGGLLIKLLKRTAKFEPLSTAPGPPAAQNIKLNIPKKTKLFVDQTVWEREHCILMHRTFQHDLYRLRLNTARSYAKSLITRLNPVFMGANELLKLSAQVQGLGPDFLMQLELQNISSENPAVNLFITFHCDAHFYKIDKTYVPVPFMVPGNNYTFLVHIKCVNEVGISDVIKAYVLRHNEALPIITAIINMPLSEMPAEN